MLLTNLIHDLDLLRHLCGEVRQVQAITSNAIRGFANEDCAAVLLQFDNGALGSLTGSDAVAAPWSWELDSGRTRCIRVRPTSRVTCSPEPAGR
jgi:predicted dehydrogenase